MKVHCNQRLLDNIEEIGHNDVSIEWSSNEHSDWRNSTFELLRTLLFLELHNKQLELHTYAHHAHHYHSQSSWFICINAAVVPYDYESSRRYSLASLFIMDGRFLRFWTIFGVLCNLWSQERCPGRRLQSEEPGPRSRKLTVKLGQNVHIFDKDVKIYTFK